MLSIEMNFSNWLGNVETSGMLEIFDPLPLVTSDCKNYFSTVNNLTWVSPAVKPRSHMMEHAAWSMSIISLHLVNICCSTGRYGR